MSKCRDTQQHYKFQKHYPEQKKLEWIPYDSFYMKFSNSTFCTNVMQLCGVRGHELEKNWLQRNIREALGMIVYESIRCFGWFGSYKALLICQNSSKFTPKMCSLIGSILYMSKAGVWSSKQWRA